MGFQISAGARAPYPPIVSVGNNTIHSPFTSACQETVHFGLRKETAVLPETYIEVSDLHLHAHSPLQTADRHPPFESFVRDLQKAYEAQTSPRKLILVLNGDILDILATWEKAPYPWELGSQKARAEEQLHQVLTRIIHQNRGVFSALGQLLRQSQHIEIHYITGNHDHWISLSEQAQQQIRNALCPDDEAAQKRIVFHAATWEVPGVALFTHGHTIDAFSHPTDPHASPWGDYLNIFLINRFLARLAPKMQVAGYAPAQIDETLQRLWKLDHLPLFWDAPGLKKAVSQRGVPLNRLMDAAYGEAHVEMTEAALKKLRCPAESLRGKLIKRLLGGPGHFHLLSWIATVVEAWVHTNRSQVQFAQGKVSPVFPNVVMGHSHHSERRNLGTLADGTVGLYLNGGTWKQIYIPPNGMSHRFLGKAEKPQPPVSRYVQIIKSPAGFLSATVRPYAANQPENIRLDE